MSEKPAEATEEDNQINGLNKRLQRDGEREAEREAKALRERPCLGCVDEWRSEVKRSAAARKRLYC